jgi:hypothetical protein
MVLRTRGAQTWVVVARRDCTLRRQRRGLAHAGYHDGASPRCLQSVHALCFLNPPCFGSNPNLIADWLFLGFVAAYTVDVVVRLVGLGFKYFFTNLWNTYDLVVIIGVNISTFPILADVNSSAFIQLQKVFLVGLVFKLVQRNDSLNQLFKTAT